MLNIQSMNPGATSNSRWKVHDLRGLIEEERHVNHELPFVALSETWLKSYISDAQISIPGYNVTRCDRVGRVGGGVLLYSRSELAISSVATYDDGVCQVLSAYFEAANTCIINVYRPPGTSYSGFKKVVEFLNDCVSELDDNVTVYIVGDFNFPNISWDTYSVTPGSASEANQSASLLLGFMSNHLLIQCVDIPTRQGSILDLFITNMVSVVTEVSAESTALSDHNLVDIMLSYNPCLAVKPNAPHQDDGSFRSLDFENTDPGSLREALVAINWSEMRSQCTFQEFPHILTSKILEICKDYVPVKKIPNGKPKALNALRRKKKRLRGRLAALKECGSTEQARQVNEELGLLNYQTREAILEGITRREQKAVQKIRDNPKYFYSYTKSFAKSKESLSMLYNKEGVITSDSKEMANVLQEQFSSVYSNPESSDIKQPDFPSPELEFPFVNYEKGLCEEDIIEAISELKSNSACGPDGVPVILLKLCCNELAVPLSMLWKESMDTGVVPEFYKKAHVAPIYKKGSKAQAVNYRPVSLTSHVVKVYERVIRKNVVNFLEDNKILSNSQHGFRSGRSCLSQILQHYDEIIEGFLCNQDTDSIYLDYSKAFDKVDHNLLIEKLKRYGFSERFVSWVQSFLSDRSQTVVVNGMHSIICKIISGVPQGTVLGPVLFLLFINDMELVVKDSKVGLFADDTRVSRAISVESDCHKLQQDLNNIIKWSRENNMQLHDEKFELLVHRHKPKDPLYALPGLSEYMSYEVSKDVTVYPTSYLRDLGVNVCSDLSWSYHISNIAIKARSVASWIFSVFRSRDKVLLLTLYKALVRSHLEYCCPVWHPSKIGDMQLIEGVQRTFTRKITDVKHLDYWERLKALGLMSLQRRRERFIIITMWKILNKKCPNDIEIVFNNESRHGITAKLPPLSRTSSARNQSLRDTSFSMIGPKLWNCLPNNLTVLTDFDKFKTDLTELLLSFPDKPPTSGYSSANHNSILDWKGTMAVRCN